MLKSILLSVDGSVYTDAQVKYAVQLARAFKAHISVLSVVDVRIYEWAVAMGTDGFVPMIPSNVYKEESKKMLQERTEAVLKKCSEILSAEKLDFHSEEVYGAPADVICEKSRLVDMLVIGARGEFARWKKNLVGATLPIQHVVSTVAGESIRRLTADEPLDSRTVIDIDGQV